MFVYVGLEGRRQRERLAVDGGERGRSPYRGAYQIHILTVAIIEGNVKVLLLVFAEIKVQRVACVKDPVAVDIVGTIGAYTRLGVIDVAHGDGIEGALIGPLNALPTPPHLITEVGTDIWRDSHAQVRVAQTDIHRVGVVAQVDAVLQVGQLRMDAQRQTYLMSAFEVQEGVIVHTDGEGRAAESGVDAAALVVQALLVHVDVSVK